MTRPALTRRRFLAGAAAIAAPWVIPATALGNDAAVAPSERITLGVIGLGDRNRSNLGHFLAQSDLQCLAVCDCFADRRRIGKEMVDRHYGNQNCTATRFHEEILGRSDIDAVLIATGDRWHAVLSMLAARAGKDVYCEKPFCLTIGEGRALVETTRRYGTVWQCGTQRRSNSSYRFVVDVVRRGMIGKLRTITTLLGGWRGAGVAKPEPAARRQRVRLRSLARAGAVGSLLSAPRGLLAESLGSVGRYDCRHGRPLFRLCAVAHDSELSGPTEYEGTGVWPPDDGFANVPFNVDVQARYADGVHLLAKGGEKGVRFEGEEGWIHLSDEGDITVEPKSILRERSAPKVDWRHHERSCPQLLGLHQVANAPCQPPRIGSAAHTMIHCANIALRLGRKVQWDPQAEQFVGDDDANRMLQRTMALAVARVSAVHCPAVKLQNNKETIMIHSRYQPVVASFFILALLALLVGPDRAAPAPEEVTSAVAAAGGYDYGKSSAPWRAIDRLVNQTRGNAELRATLEKALVKLLDSDASLACKQEACRRLWIVGSETAVPALAKLLSSSDTRLVEAACYALSRCPSKAAGQALRGALPQAQGISLAVVITALGDRRDAQADATVASLASSREAVVADAATAALGKIATPLAVAKLRDGLAGDAARQASASAALLQAGQEMARQGKAFAARKVFEELASAPQRHIRRGALLGRIQLGGAEAVPLILTALDDKDEALQAAAVASVSRPARAGRDRKDRRPVIKTSCTTTIACDRRPGRLP